jgi:hypothetical protein
MPTLAEGATLGGLAGVLHSGVVLGPAAWGREPLPEAYMGPEAEAGIFADLQDLFGLLRARKVPYLLVGGVALLTYIEGRNTRDVDLILASDSLKLLPDVVLSGQTQEFARGMFRALRLDFLFTTNPLFKLVQENYATTHRFAELEVPCATIEGLILLKLYALPSLYRQGDGQRIGLYENDVFMLCERHRPKIEPLLGVLSSYVDAGAMGELRNIVADIQRRIDRLDGARRTDSRPRP